MANENIHPLFKEILDTFCKPKPTEVNITVSSWRNTDKYPCPNCGAKLGMPDYTCEPCNIKIKPKVKF